MKKGEFFECRTEKSIESDEGLTSGKLQSDVDKFLASGGKIKTVDSLGKPAAKNQALEIEKLARNWIANHFPRSIAMTRAKTLGIDFKLVVAERKRRIERANIARGKS